MPTATTDNAPNFDDARFSLVSGGPLWGVRKLLGLTPASGKGLVARALALGLFAWLPLLVGVFVQGQLFQGDNGDPLPRHFGVHTRMLLSLPLLLIAELMAEQIVPQLSIYFVKSGLIAPEDRGAYAQVLRSTEKLRDSIWGSLLLLAALVGEVTSTLAVRSDRADELAWASIGGSLGFSGHWFFFVARPLFTVLIVLWAWRIFVWWILLKRISQLDLKLVPSHPDRCGGLGFLETISAANAPIVFASTVAIAGQWGHEVMYHAVHVQTLQPLVILLLILILVVFLGPLLMLSRNLRRFKRRSLFDYSLLIGMQGRMVHDKWIRGVAPARDDILDAPEIGPVADAITLYGAVAAMRSAPIGQRAVVPLLLSAIIPLAPVFAIEIPLKEMLAKLVGALL